MTAVGRPARAWDAALARSRSTSFTALAEPLTHHRKFGLDQTVRRAFAVDGPSADVVIPLVTQFLAQDVDLAGLLSCGYRGTLVLVTVAVDRLVSLVPPPAVPVDADGDWRGAETILGLALPEEFKVLLSRYGVGDFDDITLLSPFDTHPKRVFDLVEHANVLIPWFAVLRPLR